MLTSQIYDRSQAELWEMTEAVADALQRAELRLMERAELGVASESSMGALGSMAASMAEVGDGYEGDVVKWCLLSQWLTFWTFGDSIFSRGNKSSNFFFRVHWLSEDGLERIHFLRNFEANEQMHDFFF